MFWNKFFLPAMLLGCVSYMPQVWMLSKNPVYFKEYRFSRTGDILFSFWNTGATRYLVSQRRGWNLAVLLASEKCMYVCVFSHLKFTRLEEDWKQRSVLILLFHQNQWCYSFFLLQRSAPSSANSRLPVEKTCRFLHRYRGTNMSSIWINCKIKKASSCTLK